MAMNKYQLAINSEHMLSGLIRAQNSVILTCPVLLEIEK